MTGIELIATERARQVAEEGWNAEHDDQHTTETLAYAAACYVLPDRSRSYLSYVAEVAENGGRDLIGFIPKLWPWNREFWKPSEDRVRELVKAGALIAAEIDRLERRKVRRSDGL